MDKQFEQDNGFDDYQEFQYTDEQERWLDEFLKTLPKTLTIETKTFIKAILEQERQEEIKAFCMLSIIQDMKMQLETMRAIHFWKMPLCAKSRLYHLFLPTSAWASLLTEDRIQQWQAEAEALQNSGSSFWKNNRKPVC